MKEKITIPFYNDLLFKYFVYDNEDEGCQYILLNGTLISS